MAETAQERADRARGGFGSALPRGRRPAVVVVDLALGFTDPQAALGSDLTAVVEATRTLLDVARAVAAPVAFTVIGFAPDLSDLGLWSAKAPGGAGLVRGTRAVELDPRLGQRDGEPVFVKQGASACFGTALVPTLIRWRVDSVILAGATTSGCLRATAVDLFQHSYPVLVAAPCVGDRFAAAHDGALRDLQDKYADVVGLDEACAALTSISDH
jgi:N-formylmaleamate deformylase